MKRLFQNSSTFVNKISNERIRQQSAAANSISVEGVEKTERIFANAPRVPTPPSNRNQN